MTRFWCIPLAFFILSCGNKSAGPDIEPEPESITGPEQKPEPRPEPQYKELSYDNLAGSWMATWTLLTYSFGTRADRYFRYTGNPMYRQFESFSGEYFVNDPYLAIRGTLSFRTVRHLPEGAWMPPPEDIYYFYLARLTDSIRVSGSMSDTIGVLTLRSVPETYLRGMLNLSDTISVTPVVMSMSGEKFSSLLDSLKSNTRGQIIQTDNFFQIVRFGQ